MRIPKVYLDTTVLKFSATELIRFQPRNTFIKWGGMSCDVTVYDFISINPNDSISNIELKTEAELLPHLAELGKIGAIEYVIGNETVWESWGLPSMDTQTGLFYGAPIKKVDAPLVYDRIVVGGESKARKRQYDFLCSIKNKRFFELQKMTGAFQGKNPLNHNQLLDAFHLWCAEHNNCEFFLSLDFTVVDVLTLPHNKNKSAVQAVRPSQLLSRLHRT